MKGKTGKTLPVISQSDQDNADFQYLILKLARIDLLLRREIHRWRLAGQDPADDFRGLYVSDAAVDAMLEMPFGNTWADVAPGDPGEEESFSQALAQAEQVAEKVSREIQQAGKRPRLDQLISTFKLDEFEQDALLICLAPLLDLRYERIYGYLQDDITRRRPSANLILNLLCRPGAACLKKLKYFLDHAPLLRYHLLQPTQDSSTLSRSSLLAQAFSVDETVFAWLLGSYHPPANLRHHNQYDPLPESNTVDAVLAGDAWTRIQEIVTGKPALAEGVILAFHGPDLAAQQACARLLAARKSAPLLSLDVSSVLANDEPLPYTVEIALRDARMTGAVLFIKGWDACLVDGSPPPRVLNLLSQHSGSIIIGGQAAWLPREAPAEIHFYWLEFSIPRFSQRAGLWKTFIARTGSAVPVDGVASHFLLTGAQIRDAVATALDRAAQLHRPPDVDDLFAAARVHSNPRLSILAQKIETRYGWDDIILPDDQRALLQEIVTTVRKRPQVLEDWGVGRKLVASQGVTVLFAGPPGTGKTMAAEVIAAELGLDLYKIDLSTVVSKYIGETEKNLERIFSEAASSNAILFFDEADALFGKRSEVRDSHDRYANIEISYLLQRMEAYDGVTILATNLRANLDEAFTRRLQFSVDFPFPDEADRLRIWQTLFPPGVPRDHDLDLPLLAQRYKLAGGNIRNILVSAAYLAAADGGQVTMSHLLHGTRRELQKMGRLLAGEEPPSG